MLVHSDFIGIIYVFKRFRDIFEELKISAIGGTNENSVRSDELKKKNKDRLIWSKLSISSFTNKLSSSFLSCSIHKWGYVLEYIINQSNCHFGLHLRIEMNANNISKWFENS